MKLSEFSLAVLKNFASINSGVVLQSGHVQRTMSPEKSILVEVELDDNVPAKFGIYDLNQFLGNVTTLDNPELDFTEKELSMTDDTFKLIYRPCAPELIISPPDKKLVIDNPDVTFDLNNTTLTKILRLASMNGLPNLSVVGKNGELSVMVHERANDASNQAMTKIGEYTGTDFMASFKTENLKMLPDDYTVDVKLNAFAKFTSKTRKLTYFIALEVKSA